MKGLSEVVAVALLAAVAVVLAIGFIYWATGAYSSGSSQAQGIFDRGISNSYADVDITNVTWYSGNSTIYVSVENTGGVDLTKVYVLADEQIGYSSLLVPDQTYSLSFVLGSKPGKVIVSTYEGARDEQQVL